MATSSATPMDSDQHLQEITMWVIAAGSTTIFVAQACQDARLALLAIAAAVSAALVVKSMLYMGVISWHPAGKKRRHLRPRPWIIAQELSTALIGVVSGLYLAPVIQVMFLPDRYNYPQPWSALSFVGLMLFVKAILYAGEIDYFRHSPRRRRRFAQIAATLAIGCLLGLFLYHSRWAFKPAEWWPDRYEEVYDQPTALISFGGHSIKSDYQVRTLSSLWQDEKARLYLEIGGLSFLLCLLLKLYLYTHMPQRQREETIAAASKRLPSARAPARPATASPSKRMSPMPSPGGSKRVSKPGDMKLAKTQEHRIPTRSGGGSLAKTQEHRVAPIGKTREVRMPVASAPERMAYWEIVHLLFALGAGLIILPVISNTFWYKRAAYPYGLLCFAVIVALGAVSILHIIEILPERKKK